MGNSKTKNMDFSSVKCLVAGCGLFGSVLARVIAEQDRKLPVMASAGIGGKLHMNTNFILSLDVAKGFDPQLSDLMVGMATTYVF